MSDKIKVGDVVTLKSGGPQMTVETIKHTDNGEKAWCVWFDGPNKKEASFALQSLEIPSPPRVR